MTTVITRLYRDEASALGVRGRLSRAGFPRHALSLFSGEQGLSAGELQAKMERALVPSDAAKTYAARVADGASLVVVRATYKPLNAVRIANETFESSGALSSGLQTESFKVKTPPDHAPSILKDHPRFLTMAPGAVQSVPLVSEQLGLPLLSHPKRRDSVIHGGKLFFGDGIIRKKRSSSVLPEGSFMSRYFWPMPLISRRERGLSVIRGGGHPFSRMLGWPTLS
jgi:hypothetical protein